MAQRMSGYDRMPDELYETPAWVAEALAPFLRRAKVRSVWEPAPGSGKLAFALKDLGFEVVATNGNFFTRDKPPLPKLDAIVTNPPYGGPKQGDIAGAFIRHALRTPVRIVCMLLRSDFDHAKSRVDLFRDCSFYSGQIKLLDRIKWFDGPSSPSDNHCWQVWDKDMVGRKPKVAYAGKPII